MVQKKSELTKKDWSKFKTKLEAMRAQLTHTLHGTTMEVMSPVAATGYSQHQADQGTDDFDRTINLELSHSEYTLLRQIDRALEKIHEGNYGICDVTKEPIPLARLEAIPYATMTVQAQERYEKGYLQ